MICSCSVPKSVTLPATREIPKAGKDTLELAGFRHIFEEPKLKALIDTALAGNNNLLAASQRVAAAQSTFFLAKRAWLPKIDATATAGVTRYGEYTMDGVGNWDTNFSPNINDKQRIPNPLPDYFVGLRSSWEIDLWGKLKNRRKAAMERLAAMQEGRRLLKTGIVAGISTMYYELVALDQELEIVKRNIQLQESAVNTVSIQKSAGRANELAVQQFSAQLLSTRALAYHLQQEVISLENSLNALQGRFPTAVDRQKTATLPDSISGGIPASLLLARPDVQQAERELAAFKADVEAARASFLPALTLSPYVGLNAFKGGLLFETPASIAWGVAGGLTAPVLRRRQLKADYNIAGAQATASFYNYRQTLVEAYQEIATAMQKVQNLRAVYRLKEQEVMVLQGAVSSANVLYTTGHASYLEVITAQKSVLTAELDLVETRRDIYGSMISLYRALGGS